MISAKLMKELEKKGFDLDFPSYKAEDAIIDILKQNNERLKLAIPLLLTEEFDYGYLKSRAKEHLKELRKIISITHEILKKEGIKDKFLEKLISDEMIPSDFNKEEFYYYYDSFKESTLRKDKAKTLQLKSRNKITMNKSLSIIFSPGKMRIMDKILNHEIITDTDLKYYYRSIRPIINSMLDEDIREYIKKIENTKKIKK